MVSGKFAPSTPALIEVSGSTVVVESSCASALPAPNEPTARIVASKLLRMVPEYKRNPRDSDRIFTPTLTVYVGYVA